MPATARRMLATVNSSATMERQPEVPNLMGVAICRQESNGTNGTNSRICLRMGDRGSRLVSCEELC
jgi:hypothetical protein